MAGGDPVKDNDFLTNVLAAANAGYISTEERDEQVAKQLGISKAKWAGALQKGDQPNERLLQYIIELKRRGLKTAILSNTSIGTLQHVFTRDQLTLFDELIVSAELHITKPDPRIYQLAVERLNTETNKCFFTDDNAQNVIAAQAVGMQAIQYSTLPEFKTTLEAALAQNKAV